jgi:pimeloyl-ACP methyl ester carboxylesterase
MNRVAAYLVEKTLALGFYAVRLRSAPDPFKPLPKDGFDWQAETPDEFYAIPPDVPRLEFSKSLLGLSALRDRFTFPSTLTSPHPENNIVHGQAHLHPKGAPYAALVIVHGHAMTNFAIFERYARPAARAGLDVYYLSLPYHMQRAPHGTWSGQLSLNADVNGTAQAFRQGVKDLRSLITWIECERGIPIILLGVSLGAYTCCMTAVVDDRPATVISVLGGGSLAQLIWDGYQLNRSKSQLASRGVSSAQLEQYWKLIGPANWQPKIARDRILLMAGEYDPIVTPGNVNRLWRKWDHPALHWYPAGHGSISVYNRQVRSEILRFLVDRL